MFGIGNQVNPGCLPGQTFAKYRGSARKYRGGVWLHGPTVLTRESDHRLVRLPISQSTDYLVHWASRLAGLTIGGPQDQSGIRCTAVPLSAGSGFVDTLTILDDIPCRVAGINDECGMLNNHCIVEHGVVGGNERAVQAFQIVGRQLFGR